MQTEKLQKQAKAETKKQGDFVLKREGLHRVETDTEGNENLTFISSRIVVKAKVRDEKSESWGRLVVFKDPNDIEHRWSVPMRMLAGDATELRAVLMDLGLIITPGKARNLLGTYIQMWKVDKDLIAVEKTGWYGDSYVLPNLIIGESRDKLVFQTETVKTLTFEQKGTVEGWRDNIGHLCVGNSRLILSVCVAFAAPLLKLVNEDGGGIQWTGGSSTGKTTLLRAAGSVCGSPDYKVTWKATDNGLEGVAESRNDALLVLDELAEIDSRVAGKVAYMLANGQGKQRANRRGGARDNKKWKLLFLSSGEISLADHMSESGGKVKAGQEVRMADIPADAGAGLGCFENLHGRVDGSVFSDEIISAASQYYGTPFIEFLENINDTEIKEIAAYVKKEMTRIASVICPDGAEGQVKRVAKRFALIGIAGELARSITGWEEGIAIEAIHRCFNNWLEARGGYRDKEAELVKEKLFSFIEQHGQSRFQDMASKGNETVRDRAGFFETINGVNSYYILPSTMQEIYKGENLKRATSLLASEGLLKPGGGGKTSTRKIFPGLGRRRCYHVPAVTKET